MDSWVEDYVTDLEEKFRQLLFRYLGIVYVTACDKVNSVVDNQDSSNKGNAYTDFSRVSSQSGEVASSRIPLKCLLPA